MDCRIECQSLRRFHHVVMGPNMGLVTQSIFGNAATAAFGQNIQIWILWLNAALPNMDRVQPVMMRPGRLLMEYWICQSFANGVPISLRSLIHVRPSFCQVL